MIYECPNCQTPQEAGQTICPRCRAEFDGPVPDDAIVPAADLVPAANFVPAADLVPSADAAVLPQESAQKSVPEEAAPPAGAALAEASPLVEVPPPAPETAAAPSAPPFPAAQAYTPPYEAPPTPPAEPPFGKLSRVLLIAFPIVLVLVLGVVFYTNSLNSDADPAPVPTPAVHSPAPPVLLPAAPVTAPTFLQGGSNTNNAADDPRTKLLAGRWESKSGDYYVFNSDGTGSRGNPVQQQPEQAFLWGLVQNRVMLYRDKNEMLRFNAGPDDDTIFLAGQTGSYVQYSRSKTT